MAPPKMLPDDADPTYPLPDPRHEAFAQGVSDGMTQIAAYEAAGFVAQSSNANLLAKRPAVANRINYLIKKKADDQGLTFVGKIVVDLEAVGPDAKKLSPEWFLHQLVSIIEETPDEDGKGGVKPSDRINALKVGADWLQYFKEPKTGPMKPKDAQNEENQAIATDRRGGTSSGQESALSRYSKVFDGLGDSSTKRTKDRVGQPDLGEREDQNDGDDPKQ